MDVPNISRPTRTRRETAKKRGRASAYELDVVIYEDCDNLPPSPPPATTPPPPTLPKPIKKRGRLPKAVRPPVSVTAVVPSDSGVNAVVSGHAVPEVIETAEATIASTKIEKEVSDDYISGEKPVIKVRRKAKLKTEEHLERVAKKEQKQAELVEFTKNIENACTVDFEPFPEGPQREPCTDLPPNLDLDSPYALFSPFWTEEMWSILVENTNAYALRQGAIQRDREGSGIRYVSDDGSMNQRR